MTYFPPPPQISTALLLAAGSGSRLHPLTHASPKCLTELNGRTFLERLVHGLESNGIRRLVVVVGYLDSHIRDYLDDLETDLEIEYVDNPRFKTTNNIYSLWLAREIIQEPFLLVECDLVFDPELLEPMMEPDRMALSQHLPWMNGSTASVDMSEQVTAMHTSRVSPNGHTNFKTVNIYSFSLDTWNRVIDRLRQHVGNGRLAGYYETVLAELIKESVISLEAVVFDEQRWYEIDTVEDLRAAELLFSAEPGYSEPSCSEPAMA